MAIYMVRHGQTDWNKKHWVQGRFDVPLNDHGREQARATGKELSDVHFDVCYSSPLVRAKETAELVLEGTSTPILLDDRLVEMAYGDYEGTDWLAEDYQRKRRLIAMRYPGGESYFDVVYRAYSFLHEIIQKHKDENVLIVCHGGIGRVINSYFNDEEVDNDGFIDDISPNGGIRKYEPIIRYIPPVVPNPKHR